MLERHTPSASILVVILKYKALSPSTQVFTVFLFLTRPGQRRHRPTPDSTTCTHRSTEVARKSKTRSLALFTALALPLFHPINRHLVNPAQTRKRKSIAPLVCLPVTKKTYTRQHHPKLHRPTMEIGHSVMSRNPSQRCPPPACLPVPKTDFLPAIWRRQWRVGRQPRARRAGRV
jgi:hypothetical protein